MTACFSHSIPAVCVSLVVVHHVPTPLSQWLLHDMPSASRQTAQPRHSTRGGIMWSHDDAGLHRAATRKVWHTILQVPCCTPPHRLRSPRGWRQCWRPGGVIVWCGMLRHPSRPSGCAPQKKVCSRSKCLDHYQIIVCHHHLCV